MLVIYVPVQDISKPLFFSGSNFTATFTASSATAFSIGGPTENSPSEFSYPRHLSQNLDPICHIIATSKWGGLEDPAGINILLEEQPNSFKVWIFSFKRKETIPG